MAVDTAMKRFSMMHMFGGFCALPVPDGTIGTGDRLTILNLYSGILDLESSSIGYTYTRDKCHDAVATKKHIRKTGRRGIR